MNVMNPFWTDYGFNYFLLFLFLQEYSFVPFAVILTVLFVILFIYLPETKGLEVAEIVEMFQVKGAWKKPIGLRQAIRLIDQ